MNLYFEQGALRVRSMIETDIAALNAAIRAQGWSKPADLYACYWQWEQDGTRRIVVAEFDGYVAGYLTVRPQVDVGPFAGRRIPAVEDLIVFEPFQRKGIANCLMQAAEDIARETADEICLGVGLHSGYGPAQRLYARRGYIPDGGGVYYQDKPLAPYANCANDDDLVLCLSKRLKKQPR